MLDEDMVRLSPFVSSHLGVHGTYSFVLPDLAPGRGPFRSYSGPTPTASAAGLPTPAPPSDGEILKLPGKIVRIKTTTATREWALHDRYQPAVFARFKVARWGPAKETA